MTQHRVVVLGGLLLLFGLQPIVYAKVCVTDKKIRVSRACGRVIDKFGYPIPQTAVVLTGGEKQEVIAKVVTDSAGNFELPAVKTGYYDLRATKDGFADAFQPLVIKRSAKQHGCQQKLSIEMNPAACSSVRIKKIDAPSH